VNVCSNKHLVGISPFYRIFWRNSSQLLLSRSWWH